MSYIKKVVFSCFMISFLSFYGQEDAYPDCTDPRNVTIPLTDDFRSDVSNEIYYEVEDKFTYWYRLNVKSSCRLSYKLNPLIDNDKYDLLIYNFKGTNFCDEVVLQKKQPAFLKTENVIEVKEGEVYYFGVLHLDGFGCGHTLLLDTENKKVQIKAIQSECVEQVLDKIALLDNVNEGVGVVNNVKRGFVVNENTKRNIAASIKITDLNGNLLKEIKSNAKTGFLIDPSIKGEVIVSIEKFGYKSFSDTLNWGLESLNMYLRPLQIGDKLIMRKISFHPNTYALKKESEIELKNLNEFMLENESYYYEIQGHTNGNRTIKEVSENAHLGEEWNFKGTAKKLSKFRAERIKSYLVNNGVEETRLRAVGYGGDKMIIAKPKNMEEASQNIRVEVLVEK